ncbi:carboxypeptidase regulatory-like domain-containing protein [Pedobacter sp. JY14-1]|uniref:carboxypeptidase regulatory-like domain-containing protein n=1 Tax=Pedobacter sp. JY14-1 TaxID=3034151 RepID=UPI0023E2724C|nr:carboxypeptidase regulatory-like domain-containing protein [Pedobacter sp. JY14-1]
MNKKRSFFLAVVTLFSVALPGFIPVRQGGIRGTVAPAESAVQVFAITGKDTLQAEISNGKFAFNQVKKATYTLRVKARPPYKDTSLENVAVIDSAITDVGEIRLYN